MEKDDRILRKVVGKLIEVLHGEYSDTRDLAVVQLALLGNKSVPYICSFLEKEGDLERDFNSFHKISENIDSKGYSQPIPPEMQEEAEKFRQYFERKWGWRINRGDYPGSEGRADAVEGALEALSIIGDPRAIPTLKKLPIYDYEVRTDIETMGVGRTPLFLKAKEAIDKIQSVAASKR